jgi:hypothetical protein
MRLQSDECYCGVSHHVTHLTEADFLVDEDDRVEKIYAEEPHVAHLTKADFLINENHRVESGKDYCGGATCRSPYRS